MGDGSWRAMGIFEASIDSAGGVPSHKDRPGGRLMAQEVPDYIAVKPMRSRKDLLTLSLTASTLPLG
jgi:hypothetical protein